MSLRKATNNSDHDRLEVNISPMIDMVFILLIFFIVTTVFVEENGLRANVLGIDPGPSVNESITLLISSQGQIYSDGKEIGLGGIRATVRNKMQRDLLPVVVEVEPVAPSGIMVRVIDEVKIAEPRAIVSLSKVSY